MLPTALRKASPKFRIRKMRVTSVALVPLGANDLPVIYKSAEQTAQVQCLTKLDEQGELLAVVYAPERVDAQGHFASVDVIKEAAHDWLANGGSIDLLHDGKKLAKDRVSVAESFIVQKGDTRFEGWKTYAGEPVDLAGSWAIVAKVHDEQLRRLYREGRWNGVSLAGPAILEQQKSADADDILQALAEALRKKSINPPQNEDMTPEQLQAALAANNTALVKGVSDAVGAAFAAVLEKIAKPADKPPEVKPTEPKKLDLTDPKDVATLIKQKRLEKLVEETDFDDAESLAHYQAELEKINTPDKPGVRKPASTQSVSETGLPKGQMGFDEHVLLGKGMALLAGGNRKTA